MVCYHNGILLILVSLLIYAFSLDGDFVFDDSEAIVKNGDVNLKTPARDLFIHDFWGADIKRNASHKSYRPLTVLTFRLNKYLSGDTLIPRHFKTTNLVLHILATLLFYHLLNTLKGIKDFSAGNARYFTNRNTDNGSTAFSPSFWRNIPMLTSLLFAVHPIHVEAVSGIVGRADILSAIFYFSTIILYDTSIGKRRKNKNEAVLPIDEVQGFIFLMLAMFCSGMAVLSKETGITSLGICFVYDILVVQKMTLNFLQNPKKCVTSQKEIQNEPENSEVSNGISSFQKNNPVKLFLTGNTAFAYRQIILWCCLCLIIYARLAVMNFKSPTFQETENPAAFVSNFSNRVATYNYVYFMNMLILIWPHWMCFDWSMGCIPVLKNLADFRIIFVILLWFFIAAILNVMFINSSPDKYKRLVGLSFAMMIVPFLPSSNILFPVGFVVAERNLYIPSTGFCLLVIVGFTNLLHRSKRRYHKFLKCSFIFLLLMFSLKTWERSKKWQNERQLFESALEVCPLNAKVHYNIGKNAGDQGRIATAEREYREAIELHPDYCQAMNNLANLLKDQSKFKEAEILLKRALEIKSDFPAAWMNLGIVLTNLQQPSEAEYAYSQALLHRDRYADAHYNLGNLYLEQKKHELALKSWMEATKINPKHAVAWSNILALLDNTGQVDRALNLSQTALQELPEVAAIHFNVANLMGKKGDFETSEHHFKKAIELIGSTKRGVYYANLGVLYHRWKRYHEAIDMYRKAIQTDPTLNSAKENLNKLLEMDGS